MEDQERNELLGGKNVGVNKARSPRAAPAMQRDIIPLPELLSLQDRGPLDLDLGDLDITNVDVDFDEIDELIDKFQQDDRVKEALIQGVDLREYTNSIERDLRKVERESVADYIAESSHFASLHKDINNCDEILQTMEKLLSGFQADLGNISTEIKFLQDQSTSMSVKLRNRKNVEQKLSAFIGQAVLPETLIKNICTADVNEDYLAYLVQLNDKIDFVENGVLGKEGTTTKLEVKDAVACEEMRPHLRKLRNKAVAKTREFLLQKIYALRKPKTNVQIMQTALLKHKYLNRFLGTHAPDTASEVRQNYSDTMSRIYSAHFRTYSSSLSKIVYDIAGKNDLIGVPESAKKSGLFGAGKLDLKAKHNVFALGDRADIIAETGEEAPSIVPHVALQNQQKFPYEAIFRSFDHMLLDTITYEWRFHKDFFGVNDSQACDELFSSIFSKTLDLFIENVSSFLNSCYDAIGVLLMLRIINQDKLVMAQTRKISIPGLERYFESLEQLMWQKFFSVVELNAESLASATAKSLDMQDTRPHYVTRRYAEFVAAINMLNVGFSDKRIVQALHLLRKNMESLLIRMSKSYVDGAKGNKAQQQQQKSLSIVFLINNYDLILSVLKERNVFSQDTDRFGQLLEEQMSAFISHELNKHYEPMIAFVKKTKPKISSPDLRLDKAEIASLLEDFANSWKGVMFQISNEVMRYFSNFVIGTEILKQVLMQLDAVYADFSEVVKKYARDQQKDLIPPTTIRCVQPIFVAKRCVCVCVCVCVCALTLFPYRYELKKYSTSFE
ncbi:Vacuolar sorting protein VPS52/suppressor of actin Sac2, variant 2 [Balamuthia mandrillaris]